MKNSRSTAQIDWILIVATAATSLIVSASSAENSLPPAVAPLIVQIHADWCRTCKKLEPTWAQIREEFKDRSRVVQLDVSDREAYEASVEKAKRLDIEAFFLEYRKETGTIAVLDCHSREPTALLRGELDIEKYREAVKRAVARC